MRIWLTFFVNVLAGMVKAGRSNMPQRAELTDAIGYYKAKEQDSRDIRSKMGQMWSRGQAACARYHETRRRRGSRAKEEAQDESIKESGMERIQRDGAAGRQRAAQAMETRWEEGSWVRHP